MCGSRTGPGNGLCVVQQRPGCGQPRVGLPAAPVVSEIRLTSPYLHIVRTGPTATILGPPGEEGWRTEAKEEKRPQFSLNNIQIVNGRRFHRRRWPAEKRHQVPHRGGDPFVSTIPIMPTATSTRSSALWSTGRRLRSRQNSGVHRRRAYTLAIDFKELDILLPGLCPHSYR